MEEPLTDELLEQLLASPSPQAYFKASQTSSWSLPEYLQALLDELGLNRAEVISQAGLNATFGYQIFMGQRNASRNKLLQLAFAMGLSLQQTNRLLQAGGANELYCKNRRDAIIIFALDKGYSLQKADEALFSFHEETIS